MKQEYKEENGIRNAIEAGLPRPSVVVRGTIDQVLRQFAAYFETLAPEEQEEYRRKLLWAVLDSKLGPNPLKM